MHIAHGGSAEVLIYRSTAPYIGKHRNNLRSRYRTKLNSTATSCIKEKQEQNMSGNHFSCDLVLESEKHMRFLRKMHSSGVSLRPVTTKMVERYRLRWLPLLANHKDQQCHMMIPPSDIAWLWHCHRLAPSHYEDYTVGTFGHVLEPRPAFVFVLHENDDDGYMADASKTKKLWEDMYPEEPFFLREPDVTTGRQLDMAQGTALFFEDYDLVASCKCQANFLWQVSGSRFHDMTFLIEAKNNYYKFLCLGNRETKQLPLVPTYQIDLMWHTHILVSCSHYKSDCQAIRGRPFHHDDSLNDRTMGGTLDQAFRATAKAWEETYGEAYIVEGGMYRGEPPLVYYDSSDLWVTINVACAHVYGGSSSSGTDVDNTNVQSITPWTCVHSPGAFIRADPRSTVRNINNNPQKNGYVFGRGSMNDGYYSLDTKEAWKLLYERLSKKEQYAKSQLENFDCANCLCLGCSMTQYEANNRAVLEEKWHRLAILAA